jgi:hypothetical protein
MKNKYKKILAVATAFAVAVAGLMIQPNRTYADGEEVELLTNRLFANMPDGWNDLPSTCTGDGAGNLTVSVPASVGTSNYSTQLTKKNIQLVPGKYYTATITLTSTVARKFQLMIQSDGSNGGNWDQQQYNDYTFSVEANTPYTFTKTFKAKKNAGVGDDNKHIYGLMMGRVDEDADACTVTISNVSFTQLSDEECSSRDAVEQESIDAANAARPWLDLSGSNLKYKILDGKDSVVTVGPRYDGASIYIAYNLAGAFSSVTLDGDAKTPGGGADYNLATSDVNDGNEHTLTVVDYYGVNSVSIKFKYVAPEESSSPAATTTSAITEPAEVFGLAVTSTAVGQIEVNWGANPTYEAAGQTYKIYLNGVESRSATTAGLQTFTGLTPGASVTVKVTAILGINETSGQTANITVMAPAVTTTPVETTTASSDGTLTSNDIAIQGFQIKTNFPEGARSTNVAFRAIGKCPSVGSTITVSGQNYTVESHGIILTLDPNGDGYRKNDEYTKADTLLDFEHPVEGQQWSYIGSSSVGSFTKGYISTSKALVAGLNNRNDGNDYYVFTISGINAYITRTFHVRAFAIVTKDENRYIVYGAKAAATSVPQIADNIYRNNKSSNIQGHQYLFDFLSNTLVANLIPTTNPYYRTTPIEYGWDGNLHEEETTTKFDGMTFVPGS